MGRRRRSRTRRGQGSKTSPRETESGWLSSCDRLAGAVGRQVLPSPRAFCDAARMSNAPLFEHTASFDAGEVGGHVHVGRYEAAYEELFSEVLEDGVITAEERQQLERA